MNNTNFWQKEISECNHFKPKQDAEVIILWLNCVGLGFILSQTAHLICHII